MTGSPAAGSPVANTDSPVVNTVRSTIAALAQTLRQWQFWLLLLVAGALITLLVQLLSTEDTERYGLSNTELDGYAALARTLEDQGVEIRRSYSGEVTSERLEQSPEAAVVVLTTFHQPDEATTRRLAEHAGEHPVIWISPDAAVLEQLGDPQAEVLPLSEDPQSVTSSPLRLEAGESCTSAAALAAETMHTTGEVLRTGLAEDSGAGCFPLDPEHPGLGSALVETDRGTLFGAPDAFTNRQIGEQGHAALALWLLGQEEELIWYTPSGMDSVGAEQWASPFDFLPDWVVPLGWWLLICTGILILVQGRRHGPVISEPLPVEVPASESAEGRGRMYQNANAVGASARALRSATLLRTARALRLGPTPPEQVVLEAAARHTGIPVQEAARLFEAGGVRSNADLVRFGQRLAAFEEDLLSRLGHAPRKGAE